jgi:hypothetical protein
VSQRAVTRKISVSKYYSLLKCLLNNNSVAKSIKFKKFEIPIINMFDRLIKLILSKVYLSFRLRSALKIIPIFKQVQDI